jgi:alpha-tubulin suppressor-like RCC1 family protein
LGDGTIVDKSSPVQIGALSDWSQVSAGSNHSLATKTNGTLWAWGLNGSGQLGDGPNFVNKSSPIQIGALSDWSQVSGGGNHSLAIKTNGTLWAWGAATSGQLGDGTTVSKSSPVQIGALSDWSQVSGGGSHSLAIKTNGTLWAWGRGNEGQLGDGTTVSKSSPIQIGALSDWSQVRGAGNASLAIKTDGTLWAWGLGASGQLGDGTIVNKSSPVQIGALTNWEHAPSKISSTTAGALSS